MKEEALKGMDKEMEPSGHSRQREEQSAEA